MSSLSHVRGFLASLRLQSARWENHPTKPVTPGGLSPNTVRGYARALRQFCKFLADEGLMVDDVMERVKLPKRGKNAPKGISQGDFGRLLDACTGSRMPERDRAIVLFLADTGCRVGGLVGLGLGDLDTVRGRALVLEKGSKSRWVFFSAMTREALVNWLTERDRVVCYTRRVFVSIKGDALTVSGVNQLLRRLADRAGCEGPVNPHSFRHGFARAYILNGGDLGTLADLLGHGDIATTREFYAIFQVDELARQHARFSPVSRLSA